MCGKEGGCEGVRGEVGYKYATASESESNNIVFQKFQAIRISWETIRKLSQVFQLILFDLYLLSHYKKFTAARSTLNLDHEKTSIDLERLLF